jgi:hypothetical protein
MTVAGVGISLKRTCNGRYKASFMRDKVYYIGRRSCLSALVASKKASLPSPSLAPVHRGTMDGGILQKAFLIQGIHTEIVLQNFKDAIMLFVTQLGKPGTIVSASSSSFLPL